MSVFLHYDQKALDAEYNNRAKVKDAMDWIARYGAESARVRAELPMRFDVPFGVPADVVKAGCAVSGLYDLEPIRLCYLNEVLGLTPESARRNSPVHLKPTGRAPLVLAVGAAEGPEYHRQTNDLAAAWRALGAPVDIVDAAGLDHFSIVVELERPDSALARVIRRQMGLAST